MQSNQDKKNQGSQLRKGINIWGVSLNYSFLREFISNFLLTCRMKNKAYVQT